MFSFMSQSSTATTTTPLVTVVYCSTSSLTITVTLDRINSTAVTSVPAYAHYAMGPSQVSFSFRVEPLTSLLIYVGVCSGVCFQVPYWIPYSSWGLNHMGLHNCSPLEHTHGRHICILAMVISPCQECTECCSLHCCE